MMRLPVTNPPAQRPLPAPTSPVRSPVAARPVQTAPVQAAPVQVQPAPAPPAVPAAPPEPRLGAAHVSEIPGNEAAGPAPRTRRAGRRSRSLYLRLLRLRLLRPSGMQRLLLIEGSMALGVVLALADVASAWVVPILPVLVAGAVKFEDVVATTLARALPQAVSASCPRSSSRAGRPSPTCGWRPGCGG